MIDIRHLRTLIAIRESGTLVDAAERLHLTQSALSHQLKDLEHRLDLELVKRKTRPLQFTNAGNAILKLADELLPKIRQTEYQLKQLQGGESGRLHIAIECHSCYQWLMPTINFYRNLWPDVELDFSSGFHFSPMPALQKAQLDLVITSDPTPIAGIQYFPLFQYEAMLAVSPQSELNKLDVIRAKDIQNETLITYPVDTERLDIFTQLLNPAGVEIKNIRHAELTLMMVQLIASGRGVACLPNWALDEYLQQGYINTKPLYQPSGNGMWCTLYAAVRSDAAHQTYLTEFINAARDKSFDSLVGIKRPRN